MPPVPESGGPGLGDRCAAEAELKKLLTRARQRQRHIRWAFAALLAIAALVAAAPFLLVLAAANQVVARYLGYGGLTAAAVVFYWQGLRRAAREVGDLAATARLITFRLGPGALRDGLLPALELGEEIAGGRQIDFSRSLAQAHIESLAPAARGVDLAKILPYHPVQAAARVLLLAAIFSGLISYFFRQEIPRGARLLFAAAAQNQPRQLAPEPITGEMELTFFYPAYTHLASRTVPNTNGEISAPKGTQVKLVTRADREIKKAFIVVNDTAQPIAVANHRDLTGTLLVSQPGSYHFRFLGDRDHLLAEGPPIPIAVQADTQPQASIVTPAGDLEIDPKKPVSLRFEAQDDYGLSQITLVYKTPGATAPQRTLLQQPSDSPRQISGDYAWDMASLGLLSGDSVAYYIEATDNDDISGKKVGVSRTQYLKVYSEAEHHRQALKRIKEAWERLVALLADRLEASVHHSRSADAANQTFSASSTDTQALELARHFGDLAREQRKAKGMEQVWRALKNISQGLAEKATNTQDTRSAIAAWKKRGLATTPSELEKKLKTALEAEIAEEEKDVLYLETLLDEQSLQDLVSLSKEIAQKRRELGNLLEKYRTAPDEASRDRLINEIGKLKERMTELMQRMAELSKSINDEHVNLDALKEKGASQQMMDAFDKIQEMLHQGKAEDAMKEMEKLGQLLDGFEQNLQKATQDFNGTEFSKLSKEMSSFANNLDRLEKGQQDLLNDTARIRANYKKALEHQLAQKGDDFIKRLRHRANEAREKLDSITSEQGHWRDDELKTAKEAVEDLDKALTVKDFDQAEKSVGKALEYSKQLADDLDRRTFGLPRHAQRPEDSDAQKNAKRAAAAVPPLKHIEQELNHLFRSPAQMMNDRDKQQMDSLAKKQSELQNQSERLQQQMNKLNEQAPIFSPPAQQLLQQAGSRMGQAQSHLQGRNPTPALAEERAALDLLSDLKKGLQKPSNGGGGNGKNPIPWPWKGESQEQGKEMGEGLGEESASPQEVKIPGADQYRAPEEYRKDILDAMKQGTPNTYKEPVKRYYEEIVK